MALCVRDILELPSGQRMELVAGARGLDHPVISAEIADYEFDPGLQFVPGSEFDPETDLSPDGFIITTFLFAKDDPSLIFPAVKLMVEKGMAGLAFKKILYEELPPEVISYAESKDFPIFSFGKTVWFENIIFDIMYAVQFDDKVYLSEDKIGSMLTSHMSRSEMDIILKGISLKLRQYVSVAHLNGSGEGAEAPGVADTGRILRSFYLSKTLRDKALAVRYGSGLFLILTSPLGDAQRHRLILKQVTETLGIPEEAHPAMSEVHPAKELDAAFRESWYCRIAMEAEGQSSFDHYGSIGIYRLLLPIIGTQEISDFSASVLDPFREKEDLMETALAYAECGGEIGRTAERLCCHANTVRYRLGKIRELAGLSGCSDAELYLHLKTAVAIRNVQQCNML